MSRAKLCFRSGGGRTFLHAQHVPYPFHLTKPLYLDQGRPDLATVLLQSSSGGLYSADDLRLEVGTGTGTATNITTQASTVVYDSRDRWSSYTSSIDTGPSSFLALTPDPAILFPGARFANFVDIRLSDGAAGIIVDGFLKHDPNGESRTFERVVARTRFYDRSGELMSSDQQEVDGESIDFAMNGHGCLGNAAIFGSVADLIDYRDLESALQSVNCLAAASQLPNQVGVGVRLLAPEATAFRLGLEMVVNAVYYHALGIVPEPRHR